LAKTTAGENGKEGFRKDMCQLSGRDIGKEQVHSDIKVVVHLGIEAPQIQCQRIQKWEPLEDACSVQGHPQVAPLFGRPS
jgi:hypothetical protein